MTAPITGTGTYQEIWDALVGLGGVLQPGSWWLLPDGGRAHIIGGPVIDGEQTYQLRITAPRQPKQGPKLRLCRACGVEEATHGDYCASCV